jgi:hypothetical protein
LLVSIVLQFNSSLYLLPAICQRYGHVTDKFEKNNIINIHIIPSHIEWEEPYLYMSHYRSVMCSLYDTCMKIGHLLRNNNESIQDHDVPHMYRILVKMKTIGKYYLQVRI